MKSKIGYFLISLNVTNGITTKQDVKPFNDGRE